MLYIDGLDLTGVVSFKEVSVDFKESLTYVRGVNKDSDPVRPTGNGTGKSLFFSTIPNVWFSSTPLALKKRSRKDIISRKGSSIGLIYRPYADGPEYEIIQKPNGYQIFKGGQDLDIPTIPKAEEFIKSIFPISEIDYYSRCYISTQRPYRLLRDSDSDRLQHIIEIARLDQYSALHKHFSVLASSIKDNEIRLSVLEQQHATLKTKLSETKSKITKAEYEKLKAQFVSLGKTLEKQQAAKYDLVSRQSALESLVVIEKELDALRAKYTFKSKPSAQIKILKAMKSAARAWVSYDESVVHIEKAQKKLRAKIDALTEQMPDASVGAIRKSLKTSEERFEEVVKDISALQSAISEYEELKEELSSEEKKFNDLGVDEASVDLKADYEAHLAEIRIRLKLESILDHEHDNSNGTCPTCQSDIDFDSIRKMVALEKKNRTRVTLLRDAQTLLLNIKPLKKKLKGITVDPSQLKKLKKEKSELESEISTFEEQLEIADKISTYTEQLNTLEKPAKPEAKRPSLPLEDIESGIELCHEIEKHLRAKATLIESNDDFDTFRSVKAVRQELEETSEALKKAERAIRDTESKQASLSDDIASYEQYANTVKVYKGELESVIAEIEKLKPAVADKKLITILTKAYGTKGLRAQVANTFCNLLQTNLNHYRDLIFAEPFEFFVEASDTGVSITVDRNNGKPDAVSDVRHLSGAESECFALLCAASLITLTPDNRKLNMIVLDEPTSHLHPVSKELFTTRFLPFLKELVPSIFIIDNTDDPMCENSQQWTIIKHKGISKLQQM